MRAASTQNELGDRIAEARDRAGLTQSQLASACGLGRTVVAKIEAGSRKLGAVELVRIADALDLPADWFFSESPPAVVSRRSDPAVGGVSRVLDSRVERLARDIQYLHDVDELPRFDRLALETPSSVEQAEFAATALRRHLGHPSGPLMDLHHHAERVGLFAFSLDLGRDGGDAAYVMVEEMGVAVINGALEPGRRRFNLAHELGHHVFGDAYAPEVGLSPNEESERLINAFAVHVLLPRADASAVLREFEPDIRLGAVAAAVRYRLSWTAVCAQLRNLGLIDAGTREDLATRPPAAADFVELGERWQPELEPPEIPPKYGQRVYGAYRRGKLTAERTVELLWGTLDVSELPAQQEVPIESLHREFEFAE